MAGPNEHAVDVLNSLVETTMDSANGYRHAAENASAPQYKTMFTERAERRLELSRKLQQEVRTFGGEPKDDQSMLGKAHNKWVDLKNAVTGSDDKAVINEVERGEDAIKDKYQKALDDKDLPPGARELVSQAYASIKADHDEISRLKHQLH